MDPEKHRYSLVPPREESASGFSALRASTRSPSFRRLSLRKSTSSSFSTTDSASIHSTDLQISPQSSCVTRNIPRNECAFHRFMVWVAVKRNECERMTPSERLECPLLRCRKRFTNHEKMLRHLYTCDELDSGEYWCYDCERSERFTDAKCKRCLDHPTKRRKILSMAKNFFTSLGHKSKKEGLLKPLTEDDALLPPPSYESLDLHLTNELCSAGEIHEIDSTELLPTSTAASAPAPVSMHNPPPLPEPEHPLFLSSTIQQPPPPCIFPAELGTRISLANPHESAVETWINDPMAYVPSEDAGRRNSTEEQRMKTRSKTLAPSSSLRSNASNSSTNTTNSTGSANTASTGISPSIWSEPWTIASGFDTELESPISDLLCPSKFHGEDITGAFDGDVFMRDFIPELPADLPLLATPPGPADNLTDSQNILSLGAQIKESEDPAMTTFGNVDPLPAVADTVPGSSAAVPPSSGPQSPLPPSVQPSTLVSAILETLQAHIASSEAKLRPVRNNSLATQFLATDLRTVASHGHNTLRAKLQGRPPESTLHLLCYVHVVYAYFLVLHQEEAGTLSNGLFTQALDYAAGLSLPSQSEYIEIARAIWEPDDLGGALSTKPDSLQLGSMNPFLTTPLAVSKGKGPSDGASVEGDALLTVAQYLLDEFDYSILVCNTSKSEVLSAELFMTHVTGSIPMPTAKTNTFPAVSNGITNTFNTVIQRFGSHRGLKSALQSISNRVSNGYIPTIRQAELELVQGVHGCMPLTTMINEFAPFVRNQYDVLYSTQPAGLTWRSTHYGQVIDLVESMVSSLMPSQDTLESSVPSDMGEFLVLSTPFMHTSPGASPECATTWDTLSTNTPAVFPNSVSKASGPSSQPSPGGDCREPNSTTTQSGPGDSEPQPGAQKVEADACCDICGYRPKGDPQWFKGSMAKHKRLQHSTKPPQIYKCSYPGCTSKYTNRPDNLRLHKIEKGHFIDGEEVMHKRPSKRKKL